MADILNLGAGHKPIEGAINHDLRLDPARPFVTVGHDLNDVPWPWDDNSFDLVVATAVLEHLHINLIESMCECWRILRPGGEIQIKLPYWRHDNSYADPTHYWHFSLQTIDLFDPETKYGHDYEFYFPEKWKIVKPAWLNNARSSLHARLQVRK